MLTFCLQEQELDIRRAPGYKNEKKTDLDKQVFNLTNLK